MEDKLKPSARRPATTANAKPIVKTEAGLSAKTNQRPAAKASKPEAPKAAKPKKPKLVRDSFTIPKDEYEVLTALKQRCAGLARPSKKSELLRAGIKALAVMGDKHLLAALQAVPSIKTGRPKQA